MSVIYTFAVVVLLLLAIGGLYVGVSNDAVNFINSAVGSKAAPKKSNPCSSFYRYPHRCTHFEWYDGGGS